MSVNFYRGNAHLPEYFLSLPGYVRNELAASGVAITTLGELQECAELLRKDLDTRAQEQER